MSMPLEDQEFKKLFDEGDAVYRRSREAIKNNLQRPPQWEDITPPELHAAIKHLQREFGTKKWQLSARVECGCYLALHPQLILQPKFKGGQINLIPAPRRIEWQKRYNGVPEPVTFKFWSDEFSENLAELIVEPFNAFLKIGFAQQSVLKLPPIEWRPSDITTDNFLAHCAWVYWRAPKFVHMQPSGNTFFTPEAAWEREDAETTERLLLSLTQRMLDLARFKVADLAGEAHVSLASSSPLGSRPSDPISESDGTRKRDASHIVATAGLPKAMNEPEPQQNPTPQDQGKGTLAKSRPKADSKLNYRSPLKRAILVQLTRDYRASGLEVCRALDDEGAVELPADWSVGRNRSYEVAYKDRILRSRIEAMISKVRADMGTLLR